MALYLIGLGLCDGYDLSLRGLELLRDCDAIWLDSYTGIAACTPDQLSELCGKPVLVADRAALEEGSAGLLKAAARQKIALIVPGDPLAATTHLSLVEAARSAGIEIKIVHNASILTAVAECGLQLYRFGRTISLPIPSEHFKPTSAYDMLRTNLEASLHSLILLEARPEQGQFVSIANAIDYLLAFETERRCGIFRPSSLVVGCARLGWPDSLIKAGAAAALRELEFGRPPHCLIVPSKQLHFAEREALGRFLI